MNIEGIKKRAYDWISNKYNLTFSLFLLAFIVYRVYWFIQVGDQPLWYDEADYMNIAKNWLGIMNWDYLALRPILFPLISFIIFGIGLGETSVRVFVLLTSIISIPLLYGIAKRLFNERVGIISAFFLAVFWSFTFFSYRLLTDVPVAFLWLATIYLFARFYLDKKGGGYALAGGICLGLAFLMKLSSVVLVIFIAVYVIVNEKEKILKNAKVVWFYLISLIVVIPYFIWQWAAFGSPIAFLITARAGNARSHTILGALWNQAVYSVKLTEWIIAIVFVLGLVYILGYLALSGKMIANKESKSNKMLFLLLWLVLCLLFFGWSDYAAPGVPEERYFFIFYPVIFMVAAIVLDRAYLFAKKYERYIALAGVIIVLGLAAYQNVPHASSIIENKIGFTTWKDAGIWINENTQSGDNILLFEGTAEVTYSAERDFLGTVENISDLNNKIAKYHPKYAVISFANLPHQGENRMKAAEYVFSNRGEFIPVKTYGPYIDDKGTIPFLTIFKVNPQNNTQ